MHNLLLLGVFFLKLIMNNEIETTPTIKTNVVVMSFSINIGSTLFAFHILGETQEVFNYTTVPKPEPPKGPNQVPCDPP